MGDIAIRVEKLSKAYQIGATRERHDNLRDHVATAVGKLLQAKGRGRRASEKIWALRDVSFRIERGDVVGIIGRNGAGKSTLLKILSRVTAPTAGYAEVHGRMGSLLDVGTGFHPELTGRENIYLNGAVLGMKKAEIARKFDEIVAFAETEQFIDTPVKRYSSGMSVRLAFAVAAHLEPEVLMADEVLAVGDAQFQKKCLGKLQEVSQRQGRTVLFVSHNADAIQRLCSQCLLLDQGWLIACGATADVLSRYLSADSCRAGPNQWIGVTERSRTGTGQARFLAARYSSLNHDAGFQPYCNGPLEFLLAIVSDSVRFVGSVAVTLYSQSGIKFVNADTISLGQTVRLQEGRNLIRLRIKKLYLNPGVYVVGLWLANPIAAGRTGGEFDHVRTAFELEVVQLQSQKFGRRPDSDGTVPCDLELLDVDDESRRAAPLFQM